VPFAPAINIFCFSLFIVSFLIKINNLHLL
jgi:hypothetical protein